MKKVIRSVAILSATILASMLQFIPAGIATPGKDLVMDSGEKTIKTWPPLLNTFKASMQALVTIHPDGSYEVKNHTRSDRGSGAHGKIQLKLFQNKVEVWHSDFYGCGVGSKEDRHCDITGNIPSDKWENGGTVQVDLFDDGSQNVWTDSKQVLRNISTGITNEVWAAAGSVAYPAATALMLTKNPYRDVRKLDEIQKEFFRPFYGDLVDQVAVFYGSELMDTWGKGDFEVHIGGIDSAAQTYCNAIYLKEPYLPYSSVSESEVNKGIEEGQIGKDDFIARENQLNTIGHELTHSVQCKKYGGSVGFGYHYFLELKKADVTYADNELEREAQRMEEKFKAKLKSQRIAVKPPTPSPNDQHGSRGDNPPPDPSPEPLSQSQAVLTPGKATFSCDTNAALSTTYLRMEANDQPQHIINWNSNYFAYLGYNSKTRCQQVSTRLQQYQKEGRLQYITYGKINRLSVLCVADSQEKANAHQCSSGSNRGLVLTIKKGESASRTLAKLKQLILNSEGSILRAAREQ